MPGRYRFNPRVARRKDVARREGAVVSDPARERRGLQPGAQCRRSLQRIVGQTRLLQSTSLARFTSRYLHSFSC